MPTMEEFVQTIEKEGSSSNPSHSSPNSSSPDSVRVLRNMMKSTPEDMAHFIRFLRSSRVLREITPLLIPDIFEILISCESSLVPIMLEVCDFLPKCLRPMELYTFCMEAWVNLHHQKCSHTGEGIECRVALARSVVASIVTDVILRTDKGPLFRNRIDYLMSFGLQMLSKYFKAAPVHSGHSLSNNRMTTCILRIAEYMGNAHGSHDSDIGHSIESDVCIKLVAVLVQFRCRAKSTESFVDVLELLRRVDSAVLNSISTRSQILETGNCEGEDSGGYEVSDHDIASLVLCIPELLPLIWSLRKRSHLLVDACIVLLRSRDDTLVNLAIKKSITILADLTTPITSPVKTLLRLSIETATSVGDEEFMSLEERQSVYLGISQFFASKLNPSDTINACLDIVKDTRIDACAGLFIKMAKDAEQKAGFETTIFFAFAHCVFEDECIDVLNATDSLKSILNWARWLYLSKTVKRDRGEDEWFLNCLKALQTQLGEDLSFEDSLGSEQKTRISFIGNLVERVLELMSQ